MCENRYAEQELLEQAIEDEEAYTAAFWFQMASLAVVQSQIIRGGSRPGKSPNVNRNYGLSHCRYMMKYFWPREMRRPGSTQCGPEQPEKYFERRFRMPRYIFDKLMTGVVSCRENFRKGLKPDATGKLGITSLLKIICALRQLSYGHSSDLSDDLLDVSETTANNCLEEFCLGVIQRFGPTYLRSPTDEDLVRIEKSFAAAGFPGCIGCLDSASWEWKNCPKALQGIMIGKDGGPVLRMEVLADLDLWIWSFQFGFPGVFNDLTILEHSSYFSSVLAGTFPTLAPSFKIGGSVINWFYYLTDRIYPAWKIFVETLSTCSNKKEEAYCAAQEGVRKLVERVFGVLFRRFKLVAMLSEYWSAQKMNSILKCSVTIHNMIAELRCSEYKGDGAGGCTALFNPEFDTAELVFTKLDAAEVEEQLCRGNYVVDDIIVVGYNRRLTACLIEHIWQLQGDKFISSRSQH